MTKDELTKVWGKVRDKYKHYLYENVPHTYDRELLEKCLNQSFFDLIKELEDEEVSNNG